MKKKKGFTLVELLAVIVILAVILVIAVPQIMSVIESARKGSIESTAKLIAEGAEREYTNRKILGKDTNIECSDVSSMNSNDYGSCVITFDNAGKATVKVTGKGKFEGYTCNGNSTNMECVKGETSEPAETDARYFGYEENAIDEVIVKDKNKCVAYLQGIGAPEEQANTLCSGNALDNGRTLKDAVQQGNIPSSDYETAGLEVTCGISITGYNIEGGLDVVIPSEINGKKVVGIAVVAFTDRGVIPTNMANTNKVSVSYLSNSKNKTIATKLDQEVEPTGLGITSVVIPNTVKSIGEGAFLGNKLTEVTIPSSVTSIGNYAFAGNQLTKIIFPSTPLTIECYAFDNNPITANGEYVYADNVFVHCEK